MNALMWSCPSVTSAGRSGDMSQKYASGAKAWGICQRCGQRHYLRNLVEDGQYPGLRVCTECYEPKQPQEYPVNVTDPEALRKPSPDIDRPAVTLSWPSYDVVSNTTYLGSVSGGA